MILPFQVACWGVTTVVGVLILPTVLGWVPVIFDFFVNLTLWLIWILKYRQSK